MLRSAVLLLLLAPLASADLPGSAYVASESVAHACPLTPVTSEPAVRCEVRLALEASADPGWCDPLGCALAILLDATGSSDAPSEHLRLTIVLGEGQLDLCQDATVLHFPDLDAPLGCGGGSVFDVELAAGSCVPARGRAGLTPHHPLAGEVTGVLYAEAAVAFDFCRGAEGTPSIALVPLG